MLQPDLVSRRRRNLVIVRATIVHSTSLEVCNGFYDRLSTRRHDRASGLSRVGWRGGFAPPGHPTLARAAVKLDCCFHPEVWASRICRHVPIAPRLGSSPLRAWLNMLAWRGSRQGFSRSPSRRLGTPPRRGWTRQAFRRRSRRTSWATRRRPDSSAPRISRFAGTRTRFRRTSSGRERRSPDISPIGRRNERRGYQSIGGSNPPLSAANSCNRSVSRIAW